MEEQKWTSVVSAKRKPFDLNIDGLWQYRDLVKLFVRRTFVSKYKQTILGPAWAVIQPFFTTVVYSVFFGNIAGLGADNVPVFIFYLSGTIVWSLFSSCLTETSNTFVSNSAILGKVYFPRIVMPVATVISQFISFFIQYAFMLIFLVYYLIKSISDPSIMISPNWYILMTPVLLLQVAILGLGFGVIVSSLTTKYRDLTMMIGFGVSLWSYCSPVAYDMYGLEMLAPSGKFHNIYMLNPITPIINIFRYAYLGLGSIEWYYYGISWIVTIVVLLLGISLFNRVEKTFMDTV